MLILFVNHKKLCLSAVSKHYVQGLALLGDLKNVRPVLLPNRITADEVNNKKPNRITSARTEDAMLLKMMLQGHAPITPNPM
jgi:hypothetical protein